VKWTINLREDEALALELFQEALRDNKISDVLFVHSDNGHPMKGITLIAFFEYLGIVPSRSRPRVSDDNPFILYEILLYAKEWPENASKSSIPDQYFA
jgi:putative transposase